MTRPCPVRPGIRWYVKVGVCDVRLLIVDHIAHARLMNCIELIIVLIKTASCDYRMIQWMAAVANQASCSSTISRSGLSMQSSAWCFYWCTMARYAYDRPLYRRLHSIQSSKEAAIDYEDTADDSITLGTTQVACYVAVNLVYSRTPSHVMDQPCQ